LASVSSEQATCPLNRQQVLDRYFLEHRAALLDLAGFLDRLDRAQPDEHEGDTYREVSMKRAIEALNDGEGQRAKRIQQVFSDPTDEPAASAKDRASTDGAYEAGPGA